MNTTYRPSDFSSFTVTRNRKLPPRELQWQNFLKKVSNTINEPLASVDRTSQSKDKCLLSENYHVSSLSKEALVVEICRLRAGIRLVVNEWPQVGKDFLSGLLSE